MKSFFGEANEKKETKEIIKSVNHQLQAVLDKEFAEMYDSLRQEALEAGVAPDEVDALLKKTKQDSQIAMLKAFQQNLKAISTERSSQKVGQPGL